MMLNSLDLIRDAALNGHGLAYLPPDMVQALATFTPALPVYHLYYANQRQAPLAFRLFAEGVVVFEVKQQWRENQQPVFARQLVAHKKQAAMQFIIKCITQPAFII